MYVILNPSASLRINSAKNLIISTESIREILRLAPQNDITTQSSRKGEKLRGDFFIIYCCLWILRD
ncbi:MAG: hypothetical protein A2157_18870 [Deltaproteobacteria bacterium RBG_16_47_11]|nr:MAG: hypothetical protein A2157_18870 [Deltaproteobacteria bacterium RBG_16_47_11]